MRKQACLCRAVTHSGFGDRIWVCACGCLISALYGQIIPICVLSAFTALRYRALTFLPLRNAVQLLDIHHSPLSADHGLCSFWPCVQSVMRNCVYAIGATLLNECAKVYAVAAHVYTSVHILHGTQHTAHSTLHALHGTQHTACICMVNVVAWSSTTVLHSTAHCACCTVHSTLRTANCAVHSTLRAYAW